MSMTLFFLVLVGVQFLFIIGLVVFLFSKQCRRLTMLEREFCEFRQEKLESVALEEVAEEFLPEEAKGSEEDERKLFERIHRTIVDQRLYLNPDFSREDFMELGLLNRNKSASLLKKYAGTNLSGYINALRLEYAKKLIQIHPEALVKSIAVHSGFSNVRTFYRLFYEKYGVTPSGYKDEIINSQQGKTCTDEASDS